MKKRIKVILLLGVLLFTSYCVLTSPFGKKDPDQDQGLPSQISVTPASTPTLVPTNLVKLNDSQKPLPPKPLVIVPSGGQEIGAEGVISVQFDQHMNSNTTSKAWSFLDQSGQVVEGDIEWTGADTFQFAPKYPLNPGEVYQVSISTSASSKQDIQLSEPIGFEVRVAADLIVSQVFPADGSEDVESDAVITVIFNRPVVPVTILENQSDFTQPLILSPEVDGWGEWMNSSVYLFHPEQGLNASTRYTASIESGLEDLIGTRLQNNYIWEFSTSAPRISSFSIASPVNILNPDDNYGNVHLDSTFSIQYQQPMNKSSVSEALSLYSFDGDIVPLRVGWPSETQVVITPTQRLALGTDFTLLLTTDAKSKTGGSLEGGLRWNFRTHSYPGILSTYPVDQSAQEYYSNRFSIYFGSPMDIDTIEEKIIIKPEPEDGITWYYDAWGNRADFYGLEPSTNYSIQILPGINDIYGNPIQGAYGFSFRTGNLRPGAYLDLPYTPSIYRLGGPMKFYVSYVNVESVDVELFRIPASYFSGFLNGTYNRWEFVPPDDWWVNGWYLSNKSGLNDIVRRGIGLSDALGNQLEPGFYFMTIDSPQIESFGKFLDTRMIVVSETNITFKTTLTEGLVWITDLNTGNPIPDVSVKFYDHQFQQIGTGSTNQNGLLNLELPPPDEVYQGRFVMSDDGEPFGFASSDWGSGVSPYDFGIWSDYYTLPDQSMAYVYTDRPLYRPGQEIYFKGILRRSDDLKYSLLPWSEVVVEIYDYNDVVYTEKLPLTSFGTFSGKFVLDENAALGYYSILVKDPDSLDDVGGVSFSVAEYRKPEFQILASLESDNILSGDEIIAEITAEYYAGGAVAGAEVEWVLKTNDYVFNPGGELGRYSFSDSQRDSFYIDIDDQVDANKIIAEGKGFTDGRGRLVLNLPTELIQNNASQRLTLDIRITDIAGTLVSDQVQVVAHKASYYPGVKPSHYIGRSGEDQSFDIVVVDWNGEPVSDAVVDIEIVERRWYSVQEQDDQGFVHWVASVEEIPVAQFSAQEVDSKGETKATFTPQSGGVFKARVSAADVFGNVSSSSAYIWVSSGEFVSWRQTDDRRIELIADKDNYQPGDVAEILIASPLTGDNYALVTVERGHIKDTEVIRLASNSAVYRLPITADMAPNVYFSVLIIQGSDVGGKPDFRMGIVQLNVDSGDQFINISITPDRDQAGPGDEVTYQIKTTDSNGQPVQAEISIALADKAALALSQPNSTPILDYFYSQRSLSVRTAVPIVFSIEYYISTLEDRLTQGDGMGSGGGKGADAFGVMDVRGEFPDTAFWRADVVTDANGEAKLTVKLPDNLTTWVLDTRAVTMSTLVGDSEDEIQTTKPLFVRPQTPRFFVNGDHLTIGAAVHNNTNELLTVTVELDASGLSLKSPQTQSVSIDPESQAFVTWEVVADPKVDRVDLIFSASGGGYTDASRPTLGTLDGQGIPVYTYTAPETIGTSGILSEGGSQTEGIVIPSQWDLNQGELSLKLSPSMVAAMIDGLEVLDTYPYECVEQTVSKFLPNVLTTQVMAQANISDPVLERQLEGQVNKAIQRLSNWQRPDGGWGWWAESERSDPLTSAYVVLGLLEAENAGYSIGVDVKTQGINYLKANLQSLGSLDKPHLLNRQVFMLYVLSLAGQPQVSLTGVMFESRPSLSIYAKAYLAEALWLIDSQDPRVNTLTSDLVNAAVMSSTGVHWEEEWRDYWNWNTDTRTTSIVLSTLLRIDPDNSLAPNGIRWLTLNRVQDRWGTTQDIAWSLMTLSRWLEYSDELMADYDWAVGLNGERVVDGSVNAENFKGDILLNFNFDDLVQDSVNRLTIARDDGDGNLYYTSHLNLVLPVDQIEPLNNGIIISREYYDLSDIDNKVPLKNAGQGEILLARLTIVVPNDVHYLVVDDPLPAGFEAVDPTLETSPDISIPNQFNYDDIWMRGWGNWFFDHIELRDERVVLSAQTLPAGTYVYTYLVRTSTPGTFYVIPPTAHEFYFPEVYGRGAGTQFVVKPK